MLPDEQARSPRATTPISTTAAPSRAGRRRRRSSTTSGALGSKGAGACGALVLSMGGASARPGLARACQPRALAEGDRARASQSTIRARQGQSVHRAGAPMAREGARGRARAHLPRALGSRGAQSVRRARTGKSVAGETLHFLFGVPGAARAPKATGHVFGSKVLSIRFQCGSMF